MLTCKKTVPKNNQAVTPAEAGVQINSNKLDSRFRGNDINKPEPFSFKNFGELTSNRSYSDHEAKKG